MRAVNGLKQCSKCRALLGVQFFSKNSHKGDGLNAYCRTCVRTYANSISTKSLRRKNYELNKEKIQSSIRMWRAKNIELARYICRKNYYLNRKDRLIRAAMHYQKTSPPSRGTIAFFQSTQITSTLTERENENRNRQ